MAKDIFTMDHKSFKELNKFIKRAPKTFARAGVGVINDLAFQSRTENIKSITNSMTIRNKAFVRTSMRVDMARSNNVFTARAIVGSVSKGDSTGWAEQELRTPDKARHAISRNARGGNNSKRVVQKARLKTQNKFKKWNQWQRKGGGYRHHTKEQATVAMLIDARKGKFKGRFIVDGRNLNGQLNVFRHGLYHRKGKQIVRDQDFERDARRTKANKWMTRGNNNLDRTFDNNKAWKKAITYQLNRDSSVRKLK